jgi:hypothetical protein
MAQAHVIHNAMEEREDVMRKVDAKYKAFDDYFEDDFQAEE